MSRYTVNIILYIIARVFLFLRYGRKSFKIDVDKHLEEHESTPRQRFFLQFILLLAGAFLLITLVVAIAKRIIMLL